MKGLIALMFCFGFVLFSYAQSPAKGRFTGKIVDASTQKPVEYATITVINVSGKAVNGSVTDAKGVFEVTNIPPGTYTLLVDFIGYTAYKKEKLVISDNKPVALGLITLASSKETLASVTVTSRAPIIENKIDKIVYNAANDVTSQGGVALDVLKKVPQVTVDIDGNVELQGNSSIRFLINGKPSSVFGNNLADALASIPASQIKSIEAITSPGAKYDAQGTGGIINIILKDSKVQGYNGSINIGAGTRLENGSVNLNVRHGNFGVNAFFSGNAQLSSHTPATQDRTSQDTSVKRTTHFLQDGYSDFERNGYQSGLGFDWSISKKDNLSGAFGYNHFSNAGSGITLQQQLTTDNASMPVSTISNIRNSSSRSGTHSLDWSLDYKKKFAKEGRELELRYNASFGVPRSNYTQAQMYTGQPFPYTGTMSDNPGQDKETEIAIDYVHPLGDEFVLETGAKTAWQNIFSEADVLKLNTASGQYAKDPTQSYRLNYDRKVYAAYVSASFSLAKFLNIKTGLRLEHTDTKIDFPNTFIPSYNSWVPSIVFSHNFENGKSLKLAYSHRIERPDYREINPFVNLSDPYNISTGNPLLQPELGNNFELGFNKNFDGGGSIYISLVSRFNSNDIKPYTVFYPSYKIGDSTYSNVSVSSRQNIGLENRTGISISGSIPVTKQLTLRSNIFMSNRRVVNALSANHVTNGFDSRFNLNATYQLPNNLVLEGFGNYNTAVNNIQGKQPQYFAYTFALRKFFLNKKASFGFTATNPFSQYIQQVSTTTTANYFSYNLRQVPYRSFGISLSYKFGKLEFKKAKEEDNSFLNNPPGGNN
ncbi:MAG: outer membrane beta-barrel family protein [Bacteroidota bacterium]